MMRVFRATVLSLLRGRLFWICAFCLLFYLGKYAFTTDWDAIRSSAYGDLYFHEKILDFASAPGTNGLFLFVSILASSNILRDKKNGFRDVLFATRLSSGGFLCGKALAYLTLGVAVWSCCTAGYFAVYLSQTAGRLSVVVYDNGFEVLWMIVQRVLALSVPALTLYLAVAVSAAVLSGKSVVGYVACLSFYVLWLFPAFRTTSVDTWLATGETFNFFGKFIYPIAYANVDFWLLRGSKRAADELAHLQMHPHTGGEYALMLACTFGISAVLFILSWLKLRGRSGRIGGG